MSLSRLAPIERSSLGPQEPYNGCLDIFESLQRKTLAADEPFFSACHQVLHIEHAYFKRWSCLTGLAGDGLENWLNIVMIRDILWTLLEELDALSASILHLGGLDTSGLRLADKGEPTAHLRRVSVLNDNLAGLLPVGLRKGFTDETRLLRLSNISKAEDVENLEALWVIGSAIADDQFVLDVDFRRHVLQLELEQRPGGRKKTKHLYAPAIRSVDIRKPVAIDNEKQLQKRGCRLSRFLVYFRDSPQRAFLEYKYYPSDHAEASQEWTIFDRVQHLAAMLYAPKPSRLRVLQCMGVFEEPEKCRYGLLYRLPPGSHQHLGPETLLYHLNSRWTPSLTDRIALATSLAYSILNLHSVGWLHKNFRSENILFFPMENSTLRTLKAPYLVGFDSSRPDSKDQVSEELLSYVSRLELFSSLSANSRNVAIQRLICTDIPIIKCRRD